MDFKNKMEELKFTERELVLNKDYEKEYFTFSKESAIKALCYIIDNASKTIEIFHKPITDLQANLKTNKILPSLRNNSKVKVKYYTHLDSKTENKYEPEKERDVRKEKELELIKKQLGENVEVIYLDLDRDTTYHHKEMLIDNKYLIITSLNFLTNNVINDITDKSFWLENFSIWVKRSDK